MKCERCQAAMLAESFKDVCADTWFMGFDGWRCPVCGNILDPVILANRSVVSRTTGVGARRRHNAQAL